MCWNCCDCDVVQEKPLVMKCNGFKDKKPLVINNGHLTEHYRWCSSWSLERINKEELKLINLQNSMQ